MIDTPEWAKGTWDHRWHMVVATNPDAARMVLKAFVTLKGDVLPQDDLGSTTFGTIYARSGSRSDTRFAITEVPDSLKVNVYWTVDLHDVQYTPSQTVLPAGVHPAWYHPGWYKVFDTYDAAVMCAVMQVGKS